MSDTGERTRFEPPVGDHDEALWDATRDGVLLLPWCLDCERPHWYPRIACPWCHGRRIEPRAASGEGVVYALSVQHRPGWPGLADRVPYAVVLVDLAEGVRLTGNLVPEDDAGEVIVGTPVRLTWEPLSDGRQLPVFAVA